MLSTKNSDAASYQLPALHDGETQENPNEGEQNTEAGLFSNITTDCAFVSYSSQQLFDHPRSCQQNELRKYTHTPPVHCTNVLVAAIQAHCTCSCRPCNKPNTYVRLIPLDVKHCFIFASPGTIACGCGVAGCMPSVRVAKQARVQLLKTALPGRVRPTVRPHVLMLNATPATLCRCSL